MVIMPLEKRYERIPQGILRLREGIQEWKRGRGLPAAGWGSYLSGEGEAHSGRGLHCVPRPELVPGKHLECLVSTLGEERGAEGVGVPMLASGLECEVPIARAVRKGSPGQAVSLPRVPHLTYIFDILKKWQKRNFKKYFILIEIGKIGHISPHSWGVVTKRDRWRAF